MSDELIGGSPSPDSGFGSGPSPIPNSVSGNSAPVFGQTATQYAPNAGTSTQQQSGDGLDLAPRFRPWSEPAGQAAQGGPMRCHFLRSVGPDGRLAEAQRTAVPTHRCAAFGDPLPLSLRQQELVCLQRVHVSCPRYVRGTLLANENQPPPVEQEPSRQIPILTILGVGMVIVAAYVLLGGLMGLPPFSHGPAAEPSSARTPVRTPSQPIAVATATVTITPAPTPSAVVSASSSVRPTASPSASPSPSPSPTPTPAPTPIASATWPPGATASRMNLVTPCPDQPNCFIYVMRAAGANGSTVDDNVAGVARFFGVDVAKVYELNPWAKTSVKPGDKLKIPPPTR